MRNQQIFLSYLIVIILTTVIFTLADLFTTASQPNFQLEMTITLALLAWIVSIISFDYLTKLPLESFTPLLGAAIGAVFFIDVLGLELLDPTHINWVIQGDLAQNYFGWQFFRKEEWQWPLGQINSFYYPMGSSILYTDSLPLLAIPFKLFSNYLPAQFQYIGIWLLLSYILQGLFASLLMRLLTPNPALQAFGISFFVWMPIIIARVDHYTLTSHWLLLAGLWLYFRRWHNPTRAFAAWAVLITISALIHPYIAMMVWALTGAFYLRWWLVDGQSGFFSTSVQILILLVITVACWWMSGFFLVSGTQNLATQGFGYYSMNLFAPLDSFSWSAFIRELPKASDGQGEGFNYLGLGMWVLLLWAMYELKRQPTQNIKKLLPLLGICFLLTLLALSHKITLLHWTIIELPSEWFHYFTPFRSSGRFFWVVSYTLLFLALSVIIYRNTVRNSLFLLSLAFSLQFADLYPSYHHYRYINNPFHTRWENVLTSPKWAQLATNRHQLLLIPPPNCGVEAVPYMSAAYLANQHNMLVNTGRTARLDNEKSTMYCHNLWQMLETGQVEESALYVVSEEYLQQFQQNAVKPLVCQQIDGFWACVVN